MILGKKDRDLVDSLKTDLVDLHNINDVLVRRLLTMTSDYNEVVSIENLLTYSGLSVTELSNITGMNLQELLDSDDVITADTYNTVLRKLFEFFLKHT